MPFCVRRGGPSLGSLLAERKAASRSSNIVGAVLLRET